MQHILFVDDDPHFLRVVTPAVFVPPNAIIWDMGK